MGISTLRRHHAARAAVAQATAVRVAPTIDDVRSALEAERAKTGAAEAALRDCAKELEAERLKNAELIAQLEQATAPRGDATTVEPHAHGDVTASFGPGTFVADDTDAESPAQEPPAQEAPAQEPEPEKAARRRR